MSDKWLIDMGFSISGAEVNIHSNIIYLTLANSLMVLCLICCHLGWEKGNI